LFEEVAGVRRHERRRRRAEEQLAESETNLARVEDILAELRPQARRLAAQAEQQASRETTAEELASALLASLHVRWHAGAARLAVVEAARDRAREEVDRAIASLSAAEAAASSLSSELGRRAALESQRRDEHDAARAAATTAQMREARLVSEIEALERDRRRLIDERSAAAAEGEAARRALAAPVPAPDLDLQAALGTAERELADALAELAALRSDEQAHDQDRAAARRAAAAREAEIETARRLLEDVERRAVEQQTQAEASRSRRASLVASRAEAEAQLASAAADEGSAGQAREIARGRAAAAEADRAAARERAAVAAATLASVRARADSLAARLAEEEARGIARAARRAGGRRLDEDLAIDPAFRAAVEAALAETTRAYVVTSDAVAGLAAERGSLVVAERSASVVADDATERRFRATVAAAGGGMLDASVRHDPTGAARRLLARAAWLPDLAGCLAIQRDLPAGWIAVPRDGSAVVTDITVMLGTTESVLERRAESARLAGEVARLETEVAALELAAREANAEAAATRAAAEVARGAENRANGARRAAEEAERLAARELEVVVREAAWHDAQAERVAAELERARAAVQALAAADPADTAHRGSVGEPGVRPDGEAAGVVNPGIAAWDARAAEIRTRRDRLAEDAATRDAARRDAEHRRTRAEAGSLLADERIGRAERELAALGKRERALAEERDRLRTELAVTAEREAAARRALDEIHVADAADRDRLAAGEREAAAAREQLRAADARLRSADHLDLEARLGVDALREGAVVELAGLGELAVSRLRAFAATAAGSTATRELSAPPAARDELVEPSADEGTVSDDVAALEAAIAAVTPIWAAVEPTEPAPSPARLGQLRRRFHDLGAVNPYAVDEYAELKARLDSLEAQDTDLRTAIVRTRELIAELDTMIADKFRTTFEALEVAFATRFEQLFGGGFARLSMTDPSDLGSTGIEIVARPPGKKAQALAMLSGGERALTAVALLFAMLEVRPVPFCVLDEVDAALDEANIGRFAAALRSLAHQTQFIVITHNRGTIEAADALYGITVGDDSVSRVISLRLEEAQALATPDAGGELALTR
jgi:chromosome segregation protein